MSEKVRCTCRRCAIRGLMGPAILTTIGVLFLLGEFTNSYYFSIWRTFPVILIVIGGILLASSMSPMDGHVSDTPIAPPPPGTSDPYQGQTPGQGQ
jgi:hypothetical protein